VAEPTETVLIVEDDRSLRLGLAMNFEMKGFRVLTAGDGDEGMRKALETHPDLIILDIMLPGPGGLEILGELRKRDTSLPVLILSARDRTADKVEGLGLGADDYVTKPFNPRALVARVKAILRRTEATNRGGRPIEVGDLRLDPRRREASVAERQLQLRAREFDLLAALARDPGVVLTREALLEDVWGTDFPGETRTVDVHVAEVRKKLGQDGPQIETVRGLGYRLVPPPRGGATPGS
jgi:two-component system alkaline phosphatase synthesis response regulator PhoP